MHLGCQTKEGTDCSLVSQCNDLVCDQGGPYNAVRIICVILVKFQLSVGVQQTVQLHRLIRVVTFCTCLV